MAARPRTTPRKNATQARSRATVDAILGATARILVREGYDHASTNKIAAAAGVSVGSLYQYFPSKEALVAALIERHIDETRDLARAAFARLEGATLERAAREMVKLMVDVHALDPKLHRVLVEQVPRVGRLEHINAIERETTAMVHAFLETKRDELRIDDLELAAYLVSRTVEALTHFTVIQRPELLGAAFIDEVTAMIVRYLKAA
jgi:AcrR family transcriptional regulator